ncbi:trichohyalin-like isoform X2 [Tachysurus fulvidraco]|uniref:trichohyalin-like isoform X2 n=1 Tax=Tachysurus fulvidraco TaxID=1234273 RepID=UPI000F4EB529|nr:trichohyalin-like isoform X2 [Tachysurus fulvidraco]
MDKMAELANLLVLQEFMQNQIQFTDKMISSLTEIKTERNRLSPEESLEWSDDTETSLDEFQQRKGERRAVKRNTWQESEDARILQNEIYNLLSVKPLSEEERGELVNLRLKHRNRILKSAKAIGLEQHIEKCMCKIDNEASKRSSLQQKQRNGDVLYSETATGCSINRKMPKKPRKTVKFCLGEKEIQDMIQEATEKGKAEQKEQERIKKKKDLRKEREQESQRVQERLRDLERWVQTEEALKKLKRRMNVEMKMLKQELEIERDRKKKDANQVKKRQQCLKDKVRMLEKEIEETKRNVLSTSNTQRDRMERKTRSERQKGVAMGQRKRHEALDNYGRHFTSASFNGRRDYYLSHMDMDYREGLWQNIKRLVMAFFTQIWKGFRRVGSALRRIYRYR